MNLSITLQRAVAIAAAVAAMLALQGCLATKVVTVPVKIVYGTGKLAVKGTAAAVRAVVPDDEKTDETTDKQAPQQQSSEPQPPSR